MAMKQAVEPSVEECDICCEYVNRVKVLPCSHPLCLKCLNTIAAGKTTVACPKCRASVDSSCIDQLPWRYFGKVACDFCLQLKATEDMWYCTACSVSICSKCALTEHAQHKDKQHKLILWSSPDLIKELQDELQEVSELPSPITEKKLSSYFETVQSELLHMIEERRKEYKKSVFDGLASLYGTLSTSVASEKRSDFPYDRKQKTVRLTLKAMQLAGASTSAFETHDIFSELEVITMNPKELAASLISRSLFKSSQDKVQEAAAEPKPDLQLQQSNIAKHVALAMSKETETSVPSSSIKLHQSGSKKDTTKRDDPTFNIGSELKGVTGVRADGENVVAIFNDKTVEFWTFNPNSGTFDTSEKVTARLGKFVDVALCSDAKAAYVLIEDTFTTVWGQHGRKVLKLEYPIVRTKLDLTTAAYHYELQHELYKDPLQSCSLTTTRFGKVFVCCNTETKAHVARVDRKGIDVLHLLSPVSCFVVWDKTNTDNSVLKLALYETKEQYVCLFKWTVSKRWEFVVSFKCQAPSLIFNSFGFATCTEEQTVYRKNSANEEAEEIKFPVEYKGGRLLVFQKMIYVASVNNGKPIGYKICES